VTSYVFADELPPNGDELAELRWHWDSVYEIECRDGEWTARFHHDTVVLTARSAEDLRTLVWADYSQRKFAKQ
jgi:hypothetical protein